MGSTRWINIAEERLVTWSVRGFTRRSPAVGDELEKRESTPGRLSPVLGKGSRASGAPVVVMPIGGAWGLARGEQNTQELGLEVTGMIGLASIIGTGLRNG
jgi:hypothetical protein